MRFKFTADAQFEAENMIEAAHMIARHFEWVSAKFNDEATPEEEPEFKFTGEINLEKVE